MTDFKKTVLYDLYRFNGKKSWSACLRAVLAKPEFRYVFLWRWYQSRKFHFMDRWLLRRCALKTGIQIGWNTKIGKGLVIVHFGDIAVNSAATIGENCTISHGSTVGMAFRGKKVGNPTIGDNVWIGSNAVVVGNITVGDDVLIAPLAYVNDDVPSHSVVVGNPAVIHHRDNATEGYITNVL